MNQVKFAFVLIGSGLLLSIFFHAAIMLDLISLEHKYILYINLALILLLAPGMSISRKFGEDVNVENFWETMMKIFPIWLKLVLGIILAYGIIVFINFTYINSAFTNRGDMSAMLAKLNKGASAATIIFYAVQFLLLNLYWRLKNNKN